MLICICDKCFNVNPFYYMYSYVFVKDNKIVKIMESDEFISSVKSVNFVRKIISKNNYDYASFISFDYNENIHYGFDLIKPINIIEQKYWVRVDHTGKPFKTQKVNIIETFEFCKKIEYKYSEDNSRKMKYFQDYVCLEDLFNDKAQADIQYKKLLLLYTNKGNNI